MIHHGRGQLRLPTAPPSYRDGVKAEKVKDFTELLHEICLFVIRHSMPKDGHRSIWTETRNDVNFDITVVWQE